MLFFPGNLRCPPPLIICVRLRLRPGGEVDIGEIIFRTSFFWRREFQTNAFI
jgi:hypothetical protein